MKLILINLYKGYRRGRAVRYSRDKAAYASGRRYHEIWFKYDRIIPIIDALKTLGYASRRGNILSDRIEITRFDTDNELIVKGQR